MSQDSDRRDCLIDAIAQVTNEQLEPDQLNGTTPSDLGYANGQAWLASLQDAVNCLRAANYEVADPSRPRADALLGQALTHSQLYLRELMS